MNQVPRKWTSPIAIFISLQSGLPMEYINTPYHRLVVQMWKILRTKLINFGHLYPKSTFTTLPIWYTHYTLYTKDYILYTKDAQNWSAWFSGFSTFGQLTLDMGVFIWSMGSLDCKDMQIAVEKVHFCCTWFLPSFGGFWGRGWPLKRRKGQNP